MKAQSGLQGRLRGVYYGWWVLAACSLLFLVTGGVFYRGFTVFFLPIQREFNLSRASTDLIFSLATAEEGVGGPFVGWLIDRVDPRPLIIAGGLLAGIGYMLLSVVHGYIAFLMVYVGIVSFGMAIGLGPAPLTAVNRWFLRRKATAISIMLTWFPLGGAPLSSPAQRR
jgi:OFA family oxalate/formate antiporter-like MFS transporter